MLFQNNFQCQKAGFFQIKKGGLNEQASLFELKYEL